MIPFAAGFSWGAVARIAVVAGVCLAVWLAWQHYEGLLDGRIDDAVTISDLQYEKNRRDAIIKQREQELFKSNQAAKYLRARFVILEHDRNAWRSQTITLENENAEYKAWRAGSINSVASDRMLERAQTIRDRLSGMQNTNTPDTN